MIQRLNYYNKFIIKVDRKDYFCILLFKINLYLREYYFIIYLVFKFNFKVDIKYI